MSEDPKEVFQVLEKLGQGSYGTVRKCLDKRNGKIVAVKSIEKGEGDNLAGIMKEIKLLEKCDCPDVVSYFGCLDTPSELLIEMEYCAAGSALDLMKVCGRKFSELEVAATMAGVLRGLDYLHKKKIIHRDIKAGNVLLNNQGQAKLADFGVAIQLQSTFQKRATVTGSPYWMAPDVIDQKGGYTNKADLWSLGITAIELAEGEPPLYSVHFARVLFMIVRNPPPKLKEPNNWSADLIDFLAKCLQKDPMLRPSAEELLKHPFVVRGAGSMAVLGELVHQCIPKIEAARIAHWKSEEQSRGAASSMQPLSQSQFSGSVLDGGSGSVIFSDGSTRSSTASSASSASSAGGSILMQGGGSMVVKDGTGAGGGSMVIHGGSAASSGGGNGSMVIHSGTGAGVGSVVLNSVNSPAQSGSMVIHGGTGVGGGSVVLHSGNTQGGSMVINADSLGGQGGSMVVHTQGGSMVPNAAAVKRP